MPVAALNRRRSEDFPKTRRARPKSAMRPSVVESLEERALMALLGVTPEYPRITYNGSAKLDYNATSDLFRVQQAIPLSFFAASGGPSVTIQAPDGATSATLAINAFVDAQGRLSGGVAGDDLAITGALTIDGVPVSGTLLTGEVERFGFLDVGTTDQFDFVFRVTGGALADRYDGRYLGVTATGESSTFANSFETNFGAAKAKGTLGGLTPARLGDFVFNDLDTDGLQDLGEPGVEGVTVQLLDVQNQVVQTKQTDDDGRYLFETLDQGYYRVKFFPLAGSTLTTANVGSNEAIDSDADPSTGVTERVLLLYNQTNLDLDAGLVALRGSIEGHKYRDLTGNGLSADDTGLIGTTIYLDQNDNGRLDDLERSTVTDADGSYRFDNLIAGAYHVREVVGTGFVRTGPASTDVYTIQLGAGQVSTGVDFANFETCNLGRFTNVSYIINGSRHVSNLRGKTDPGDVVEAVFTVTPGSPVMATLVSYNAPDPYFSAGKAAQQVISEVDTGTFEGGGTYRLVVRNPNANYQVDFVCGMAIDHFGPAGGNIFYSPQRRLISADNDGNAKPLADPSIIAGSVYLDANNNGLFDDGETPLAYVPVTLNGVVDGSPVSFHVVTKPDGSYRFDNLKAGSYTVKETQPNGLLDGFETFDNVAPIAGSADGSDTIGTIVLAAGQSDLDNNFGELKPSSIAGLVFEDTNQNGALDSHDRAISGVEIVLTGTDDLGRSVTIRTRTDGDGRYRFDGLRPGTYEVSERQPDGFDDALDFLGSAGGVLGNDFSAIALSQGIDAVGYNFSEVKQEVPPSCIQNGQTATIGFWHNKNGQRLIKSTQGSELADWLAEEFPNLYGFMRGRSGDDVASLFQGLFNLRWGPKAEAQVMATALNVYFSTSSLGGDLGTSHGFRPTASGLGGASVRVGLEGCALGIRPGSSRTVDQLLDLANSRACWGIFYMNSWGRGAIAGVFSGINEAGSI